MLQVPEYRINPKPGGREPAANVGCNQTSLILVSPRRAPCFRALGVWAVDVWFIQRCASGFGLEDEASMEQES